MTDLQMATCPLRHPGVSVQARGDEPILVRADGTSAGTLNHTALALWQLCDGRTTVDEMVHAVESLYDADTAQLRRDVQAVLRRFAELGLVQWNAT